MGPYHPPPARLVGFAFGRIMALPRPDLVVRLARFCRLLQANDFRPAVVFDPADIDDDCVYCYFWEHSEDFDRWPATVPVLSGG